MVGGTGNAHTYIAACLPCFSYGDLAAMHDERSGCRCCWLVHWRVLSARSSALRGGISSTKRQIFEACRAGVEQQQHKVCCPACLSRAPCDPRACARLAEGPGRGQAAGTRWAAAPEPIVGRSRRGGIVTSGGPR